MVILISLSIILFGLFTTWLILKILSKQRTVEAVSLQNKTLREMSEYSQQNGWDYDSKTNTAIRINYKHNINENVIKALLLLWIPMAVLICILGIVALNQNTFVETKQYNNQLEREKIVVRLEYYNNYGTEIYKNDTALNEYTKTLEQVQKFNSEIYFANTYKDNARIGIFINKGYVGLEPIKYTKL